ncbi:hypothetical protein BGZ73_007047 [Actinomortierella ambigua]|nr:hypothetical protein BGZ73_007047 [Actinomortierella ambigua]
MPNQQQNKRAVDSSVPLPIALLTSHTSNMKPTLALNTTSTSMQLKFPPPPAVLGSQPLYYLAKRFPLLAEAELKQMPQRTALDYSSFVIGAMSTSYPSAATMRAVVRQFRNFLKESGHSNHSSRSAQSLRQPTMEPPRVRIWAQTIRALIWLKQYRRARVAIHAMQRLDIRPSGYAWRSICRGWIQHGQLDRALAIAVRVFQDPSISHDYGLDEKPYYFSDMQDQEQGYQGGGTGAGSSSSSTASGTAATTASSPSRVKDWRKHRSPMAHTSAPLFLVIEALAERGEMEKARYWFDQIPQHQMTDMLTSDMVAGYLQIGQEHKAQEVIQIMARCGIKPTAIVFNPILEHSIRNVGIEAAEEILRDMARLGIASNLFSYKILVQGYIRAGRRDKVLECLEEIKASGLEMDRSLGRLILEAFWNLGTSRREDQPPVPVHQTISLEGEQGGPGDVEGLLKQHGADWTKICLDWIDAKEYEKVDEAMHIKLDELHTGATVISQQDRAELAQVVKALLERRELSRARHWFDTLFVSRDTSPLVEDPTCLALMDQFVRGYFQSQQPKEAEAMIQRIQDAGIRPTIETFNLALEWSMATGRKVQDGEQVLDQMHQAGLQPSRSTFEILCRNYAALGDLRRVETCVSQMEQAGFALDGADPSFKSLVGLLLGADKVTTASSPVSDQTTTALEDLCAQLVRHGQMEQAESFVRFLMDNPNVKNKQVPWKVLIQGWIDVSQGTAFEGSLLPAAATATASSVARSHPLSAALPTSESLVQQQKRREASVSKMSRARAWFDHIASLGNEDDDVEEASSTTGDSSRSAGRILDLDLCNRMVAGYMALGLEDASEEMIRLMAQKQIKPDIETYNHILDYTVRKLDMSTAENLVHKMQTRVGLEPNQETWNILIRGYVIRNRLTLALYCLDRMKGIKVQRIAASSSPSSPERQPNQLQGKDTFGLSFEAVVSREAVEPNETTMNLILAGFGPDIVSAQGQGQLARALQLYRERVQRQLRQAEQLRSKLEQGLLPTSAESGDAWHPDASSSTRELTDVDIQIEVEDEAELMRALDRWAIAAKSGDVAHSLGYSGSSSASVPSPPPDLFMTDWDWKSELEWEERMVLERERERELNGRLTTHSEYF